MFWFGINLTNNWKIHSRSDQMTKWLIKRTHSMHQNEQIEQNLWIIFLCQLQQPIWRKIFACAMLTFEYSNEFLQSLATVQKHCHLNAIYRLRDTFVVHNLYNFMCAMQFALCHYFLNCFAASSQFRWMYRPHKHSQTLISLSLLEIIWIRGKKTKSMFTQLLREEAKIL